MPFLFESFFFLTFLFFAVKVMIQVARERRKAPEIRLQRDWGDVEQLLREGKAQESLAILHARIHEGAPSLDIAYTLKAQAQYALGRYGQALKDSYRALSENLYYTPAYIEKLKALYQLGELDLAWETCEYLRRLDPYIPEIYYYQAFISEKRGEAELAERQYAAAQRVRNLHS